MSVKISNARTFELVSLLTAEGKVAKQRTREHDVPAAASGPTLDQLIITGSNTLGKSIYRTKARGLRLFVS